MKDSLRRTPSTPRSGLKDTLRRTSSRSGLRDIVQRRQTIQNLQGHQSSRSFSSPAPRSVMPQSSTQRFQLPVLGPLDSLTKGTNIPPPPDSPIEDHTPAIPPKTTQQSADFDSPASKTSNYNNENQSPNSNNQDAPSSPASTKPSSIRKFLSRKSLNQSYATGNTSDEFLSTPRPESPATFSTKNSRRKSGGNWLKRLVSGSGSSDKKNSAKRTSTVFESMAEQENVVDQSPPAKRLNGGGINGGGMIGDENENGNGSVLRKVDTGPPAPKLPELNQFRAKVDENTGSFGGGDMFADIGKSWN